MSEIAPNGKTTILAKETDTKQLVDDSKKKSKTADLVKEANEFAEKNKNNQVLETISLEQEEDKTLDR